MYYKGYNMLDSQYLYYQSQDSGNVTFPTSPTFVLSTVLFWCLEIREKGVFFYVEHAVI